MKLYVALTLAAKREPGPMVGADTVEIGVEVPDRVDTSYDHARREAIKEYCARMSVTPTRVWVWGVFG